MEGRVGHFEAAVGGTVRGDRRLPGADAGDEVGGQVIRVEARRSERRMRGAATTGGTERELALVPGGDAHRRRLADDDEVGANAVRAQALDHRADADAAGLLVVREGEVEGRGELLPGRAIRRPQAARDEALHVGGAAAEQAIIAAHQPERIARPRLSLDRHDVGVARRHGPAPQFRRAQSDRS